MLRNFVKKIKEHITSRKGAEIVAIALVLLFIILAAAPHIKTLGRTTGTGVSNLNTQMEDTLNE
ncbi:flagellin [Thermoanaerobacterium sp. DL9XJH110]|uniref:flagellin n=1 Tax=Thermoanaerobacterium sp. DL9XJH110 TaxID=3386643 RepID=UPI003BB4A6BF